VVHVLDEPLQRHRRHASNASNDDTSRVRGVSRLGRTRSYRRAEALDAWRAERFDIALVGARLQERADVLAAADWGSELGPALDGLNRRAAALEERTRALRQGRATRSLAVLGLFFRGRYGAFRGWRSAARDLLR